MFDLLQRTRRLLQQPIALRPAIETDTKRHAIELREDYQPNLTWAKCHLQQLLWTMSGGVLS
jgi:hypothetical protein